MTKFLADSFNTDKLSYLLSLLRLQGAHLGPVGHVDPWVQAALGDRSLLSPQVHPEYMGEKFLSYYFDMLCTASLTSYVETSLVPGPFVGETAWVRGYVETSLVPGPFVGETAWVRGYIETSLIPRPFVGETAWVRGYVELRVYNSSCENTAVKRP